MDIQAAKETILEATLKMFYEKGLKFTMSDIAVCAGMSKRTIYMVFADKESLFYAMVDYCFDKIKDSEKKVLEDASLDTVGKIRAILSVLPEGYSDVGSNDRTVFPAGCSGQQSDLLCGCVR